MFPIISAKAGLVVKIPTVLRCVLTTLYAVQYEHLIVSCHFYARQACTVVDVICAITPSSLLSPVHRKLLGIDNN